jgi:hypothetical protein
MSVNMIRLEDPKERECWDGNWNTDGSVGGIRVGQGIDLGLGHGDDLPDVVVSSGSEGKWKRVGAGELEEVLQDVSEGKLALLAGKHVWIFFF